MATLFSPTDLQGYSFRQAIAVRFGGSPVIQDVWTPPWEQFFSNAVDFGAYSSCERIAGPYAAGKGWEAAPLVFVCSDVPNELYLTVLTNY